MHNKSPDFLKLQDFFYWLIKNLEKFVTKSEYKAQLSYLRCIKRKIIIQALENGLVESQIPFIPILQSRIIRAGWILMSRQISFVRVGQNIGKFDLLLNKVFDLDPKIPERFPYYIIGINLNPEYTNMDACSAKKEMLKKGEKPLTLIECVSLLIHKPELLLENQVIACGSEYGELKSEKRHRTPCIILIDNIPTIKWCFSDEKTGAIYPSCIRRVGTIGLKAILQGRPWRMVGPI
jgi:hypothetical protein